MKPMTESFLLGLLVLGLPVAFYTAILRPATQRKAALRHRLQAAQGVSRDSVPFTPLSEAEQAFLKLEDAPWRTRLPLVGDDQARLAHLHRVVSELNAALKARGVPIVGLRGTWEPIAADFTLPVLLATRAAPPKPVPDAPEYRMAGWVLEVELPGTPGALFQALAAVSGVNPLLEPVGLRWGFADQPGEDGLEHHQYLLLRNLYLQP